jgi:hypothetical protein
MERMADRSNKTQRRQKWNNWPNTTHSLIKETAEKAPAAYKKKLCNRIYDIKHDGRHKIRLVAAHLPDPNIKCAYSGVRLFRGIHLIAFLGELNKHELWGAEAWNAYLERQGKRASDYNLWS